jgi:hypothetical protein
LQHATPAAHATANMSLKLVITAQFNGRSIGEASVQWQCRRQFFYKENPELSEINMEINDLRQFGRWSVCPQTGHRGHPPPPDLIMHTFKEHAPKRHTDSTLAWFNVNSRKKVNYFPRRQLAVSSPLPTGLSNDPYTAR